MAKSILEMFILTANCGSFEKASKQLFISSTALIKQINRLEADTGLKLFERTNKGIILTTSGKFFYEAAEKIMHTYYDAIRLAKDIEARHAETLRLGISMINPYINAADKINYSTNYFAQSYISIVPIECNYKAFADQFTNLGKEVDVIPYFLGNQDLDLICNSYCIAKFPFRIAVPITHPLAQKETLTFADLCNQNIVTMNGNLNIYYKQVLQAISEHATNVKFHDTNFYDYNTFDYVIHNNYLLLVGDYLKDIHPSLILHPVDWDFTLPYGIYYSLTPSDHVKCLIRSFLEIDKNGKVSDAEVIEI